MTELVNTAKNKTILIIDDAASMRSLLVSVIKSLGINKVYDASNGPGALRLLERRSVDIIFCDWEMPDQTGIELFEQLKQDPRHKSTPFVLVTSVSEIEKVKSAIETGIEHYVVKPFKEATIIQKLNGIFPDEVDDSDEAVEVLE